MRYAMYLRRWLFTLECNFCYLTWKSFYLWWAIIVWSPQGADICPAGVESLLWVAITKSLAIFGVGTNCTTVGWSMVQLGNHVGMDPQKTFHPTWHYYLVAPSKEFQTFDPHVCSFLSEVHEYRIPSFLRKGMDGSLSLSLSLCCYSLNFMVP